MTSNPANREAVSVPEAARILGMDPRTVRQACKTGEIYSVRIGARWLIPKAPLLAMLRLDGEAAN